MSDNRTYIFEENIVEIEVQTEDFKKALMVDAAIQTDEDNEAALMERVKELEAICKSQRDSLQLSGILPMEVVNNHGNEENDEDNDDDYDDSGFNHMEICDDEFSPDELVSENAMVPIGPNGTQIPVADYKNVEWEKPSKATRALLLSIFDKETLATHSMTGKASPAFSDSDRPVKPKLDQNAVQDIIFAVSKKCAVGKKLVKNVITTKCADATKTKRLMEQKERERKLKEEEEKNKTKTETDNN